MNQKENKDRIAKAFRAMKEIGISEAKVKPVLKNLLKVYEKNWELIEEGNYRALADAIFEKDEKDEEAKSKKRGNSEAPASSKKIVNSEKEGHSGKEAQATKEQDRPLKRLRRKYVDGQTSSPDSPNSSVPKTPLVKPKEEPNELPQGQSLGKRRGKQPISSTSVVAYEENTELVSPAHPMRLRNRGTRPISPQTPPVEKNSSSALCRKEPWVEPGILLLPKQKSTEARALVEIKDEPITDDIPCLEAPIAVVYPDQSNEGDSSSRNGTIRELGVLEPSVLPPLIEKETADITASPNEPKNNGELAMTSSPILEIASSTFGEMKLSLSYDSARGSPDFQMPSLGTILKAVEDKCLRTCRGLDPNFSLMNVMKEVCYSGLELGSGSSNKSPVTIDVDSLLLPPCNGIDDDSHLEKMDGEDNMETNSEKHGEETNNLSLVVVNQPELTPELNLTVDSKFDPKTPLLPPPCNGVDGDSHLKKMDGGDDLNLVVVNQTEVTPEVIGSVRDAVDIAKGQEKVIITVVNEVNNEGPPSFRYIPQNAVFQNARIDFSLARIEDEKSCFSTCFGDCLSLSAACVCGDEFAYTTDGLVKEEFLEECIAMNRNPEKYCQFFCKKCPVERSKCEDMVECCKGHLLRKFIRECWWKCGCHKQCGNRVVQRGITRNLEVFMTSDGKGWGLRTLVDLPKGAFVCEYVGEVLTNAELFDRVLRGPKREKHSYPVLLDADWATEEVMKDEEALCLDATYYGNAARFINHRCYDSNLVEIPVQVETPDRHYYHLAFFTTREVKAMEELTRDYGIDFDDHDHPIKAFSCQCGSKFCRNIKRSRSRAVIR